MPGGEVFVSYSQPDRELAFQVVAQLESRGMGVWVAPRDISPAADWAAEIIDAISAARVMVLVFSSHCNASPQVRREVERAVHRRVPILPLRIEDVLPERSLEYFLSSQHWLDAFTLPREPQLNRLCVHVAAMLNGTPTGLTGAYETIKANAAAVVRQDSGSSSSPLGVTELESLERRLAYYVGPVAKHLVKRAAGQTADRNQLMLLLAAEVEPMPARQQFIEACKADGRSAIRR